MLNVLLCHALTWLSEVGVFTEPELDWMSTKPSIFLSFIPAPPCARVTGTQEREQACFAFLQGAGVSDSGPHACTSGTRPH